MTRPSSLPQVDLLWLGLDGLPWNIVCLDIYVPHRVNLFGFTGPSFIFCPVTRFMMKCQHILLLCGQCSSADDEMIIQSMLTRWNEHLSQITAVTSIAVAAFHSTKEGDFPKYYQKTSSGAWTWAEWNSLNETILIWIAEKACADLTQRPTSAHSYLKVFDSVLHIYFSFYLIKIKVWLVVQVLRMPRV